MNDATLWNQILIWPILNLLMFFYRLLTLVGLPGAFGFSILLLTALIRIVLHPLTQIQLKSARKIQKMKPKLDEISKRHKGDKVKLQQAQMELYKEHGINPAAGCLPLLVQIPFFISLYNVFNSVLTIPQADLVISLNKLVYHPFLQIAGLDLNFFGLSLATKPNQWQTHGIGLLLIPVITGVLQFIQTRLMTPPSTTAIVKKDKNDKVEEDPMQSMQKQMGLIMPVMIGFFSLSFPVGLSLYWNTFTVFGIIQQLHVNKHT